MRRPLSRLLELSDLAQGFAPTSGSSFGRRTNQSFAFDPCSIDDNRALQPNAAHIGGTACGDLSRACSNSAILLKDSRQPAAPALGGGQTSHLLSIHAALTTIVRCNQTLHTLAGQHAATSLAPARTQRSCSRIRANQQLQLWEEDKPVICFRSMQH